MAMAVVSTHIANAASSLCEPAKPVLVMSWPSEEPVKSGDEHMVAAQDAQKELFEALQRSQRAAAGKK